MLYLLIAAAAVFNLIILRLKFSQGRYGDMALDFLSLSILTMFFGHTLGGMTIVAIAGSIMSVYWYFFPPSFGGY